MTADKSAVATSELINPWTIDKSVTPEVMNIFEGDSAAAQYTVAVTRGTPTQVTTVSGQVCITNGGAVATEGLQIIDYVYAKPSDSQPAFSHAIDVSAMPVLQPMQSHCYPYSYQIDAVTGQTVKDTAQISITNHSGSLGELKGPAPSATVTVNTYAPAVAVTSGPSWDRDWTWSIDKSVTPTTLTLAPGQTYPVDWTVTVAPTSADSGHQVAGTITVSNPAPIAANLTSVVAAYGELGVSVTCPSLQVAANSSLDCTYSVDVSGPVNGTLVATATLQNYSYTFDGVATATGTTSFQGSADVAFSDLPSVETDECVTVMDTMAGELGYVCQGDQTKTFRYTTNVGPYAAPGTYTVRNVATFVTNDTETTGQDVATVTINIPATGTCTLTQGYWKTHSALGPAPYDDNWANLDPLEEGTLFYASGQTWHEVFWTPPAGNAYYNLAHQYMAAKLNLLNGADGATISKTIAQAEALFASLDGTTLTKTQTSLARKLASTLDSYNNGLIGPGHCSEPAPVS